jgi:hypothetical protein
MRRGLRQRRTRAKLRHRHRRGFAMLRSILAVLAGLVSAWITVSLFEFASMHAFPPPPGVDVGDPQQLASLVAGMPVGALALVLAGWVVGALDGGLVAMLVAKRRVPAIMVGVLVMLGAFLMVAMVPHPMWMSIAGVLLPVPAALFGAWLARGRAAVA